MLSKLHIELNRLLRVPFLFLNLLKIVLHFLQGGGNVVVVSTGLLDETILLQLLNDVLGGVQLLLLLLQHLYMALHLIELLHLVCNFSEPASFRLLGLHDLLLGPSPLRSCLKKVMGHSLYNFSGYNTTSW